MFRSRLSLLFLIGVGVGCEPAAEKTPAEGGRVSLWSRYATAGFFTPGIASDPNPLAATETTETTETSGLLAARGPCSQLVDPPARELLDAGAFVTLVGPAGPIVLNTTGGGDYSSMGFDSSLVVADSEYDIEIPGSLRDDGIAAVTLHAALHMPQPVRLTEPDLSQAGRFVLTSGESVRFSWEPLFPPECVLVTRYWASDGGGFSQSWGEAHMTDESSEILTASGDTCGLSVTRLSERHVPLTADAYIVTIGFGSVGAEFSVH